MKFFILMFINIFSCDTKFVLTHAVINNICYFQNVNIVVS